MIKLPSSTVVNRRVPKERFYLGRKDVTELKSLFTSDVEKIVWMNKLSPQSMNLPPSDEVREIEIFEATLSSRTVDKRLYVTMDEAVKPHVVLYIFKTVDHVEVVLGYRQAGEKTVRYYTRSWQDAEAVELDFAAPTLDALYLSLMRQLSMGAFAVDAGATVAEAKAKDARRQGIESAIAKLECQLKREKQMNRQFEISGEIRKLKKELRSM
jgi:hypothetical protein